MRYLLFASALLAVCSLGWTAAGASPAVILLPTPVVTPAATAIPGWPGGESLYLGRYRITASTNKKLAKRGQLTVFMRTFKVGVPPVMSGVLALYGKKRSNIFYLTQFSHFGTRLQTVVNLGSYAGPVIGKFVVLHIKGKTMQSRLLVTGIPKTTLKFLHFSSTPQP